MPDSERDNREQTNITLFHFLNSQLREIGSWILGAGSSDQGKR